jgi:hypothetical protein
MLAQLLAQQGVGLGVEHAVAVSVDEAGLVLGQMAADEAAGIDLQGDDIACVGASDHFAQGARMMHGDGYLRSVVVGAGSAQGQLLSWFSPSGAQIAIGICQGIGACHKRW